MRLHGRLTDVRHETVSFAADLKTNLDNADAVSESIKDSIDAYLDANGIQAPSEARYVPVWTPESEDTQLDLIEAGITTVVWSTGFGRDHRWINVPVFDGSGYPTHQRGVTSRPGLYFLGLPWQHTWGSGRFCGVGPDAEYLTRQIVAHQLSETEREVHWIAGTAEDTNPRDEDWYAPRTVA
jgi:putative flavoprotein involved in K+ transport